MIDPLEYLKEHARWLRRAPWADLTDEVNKCDAAAVAVEALQAENKALKKLAVQAELGKKGRGVTVLRQKDES